jgi:hypothetical protein
MNGASVKALVALIPMSVFFAGSVVISLRRKCIASFLQLFGATGLLGVVLIHVCEALGVLTGMGWGLKDSIGHYLDLLCATVGFTLFPVGYLMHAVRMCADEKDEQKL